MPAIQLGNQTVEFNDQFSIMDGRQCSDLTGSKTNTLIYRYSINGVVGQALQEINEFISDTSNSINARENACYDTLSFVMQAVTKAGSRRDYLEQQLDNSDGGCCGFGWQCYGNNDTIQCCWNSGEYNEAVSTANSFYNQMVELHELYSSQLTILQEYQDDEISDQEYIRRVTEWQAQANEAIARAEEATARAEIITFFQKNLTIILPVLAVLFIAVTLYKKK